MLRKTYSPDPFDTDVCSTEVSTLDRTMVAPGITAPLGSRTTPFTEAVDTWALAEPAKSRRRAVRRPAVRRPRSEQPPWRAKRSSCMYDLSTEGFVLTCRPVQGHRAYDSCGLLIPLLFRILWSGDPLLTNPTKGCQGKSRSSG